MTKVQLKDGVDKAEGSQFARFGGCFHVLFYLIHQKVLGTSGLLFVSAE